MTAAVDVELESLPVVGRAYRLGVNPITTTLVLVGPLVLAAIAALGRNSVTIALAAVYVAALPASVAYFRLVPGKADVGRDDGDGSADDSDEGEEDDPNEEEEDDSNEGEEDDPNEEEEDDSNEEEEDDSGDDARNHSGNDSDPVQGGDAA